MAQEALVAEGEALLGMLPGTGLVCTGAFWLRPRETEEWSLILVMPRLPELGPRAAYSKILNLLATAPAEFPALRLTDVRVVDPEDPIVDSVRALVRRLRAGREIHVDRVHASTGADMVTYNAQ